MMMMTMMRRDRDDLLNAAVPTDTYIFQLFFRFLTVELQCSSRHHEATLLIDVAVSKQRFQSSTTSLSTTPVTPAVLGGLTCPHWSQYTDDVH